MQVPLTRLVIPLALIVTHATVVLPAQRAPHLNAVLDRTITPMPPASRESTSCSSCHPARLPLRLAGMAKGLGRARTNGTECLTCASPLME